MINTNKVNFKFIFKFNSSPIAQLTLFGVLASLFFAPNINTKAERQVFADVAVGSTFNKYIEELKDQGVVSGFNDGTFRPNANVSRGEMSKFVVKAFALPIDTSCGAFADVPTTNTFYNEITTLKCLGIVSGFGDNTFKPEGPVSRGEVAKFLAIGLEKSKVVVTQTTEQEKERCLFEPLYKQAKKLATQQANLPIDEDTFYQYEPTKPGDIAINAQEEEFLSSPFCLQYKKLIRYGVFAEVELVDFGRNQAKQARIKANITRGEMSKVVWKVKNIGDWAYEFNKDIIKTDFKEIDLGSACYDNFMFIRTRYDQNTEVITPAKRILNLDIVDNKQPNTSVLNVSIDDIKNKQVKDKPLVLLDRDKNGCPQQNNSYDDNTRFPVFTQVLKQGWTGSDFSSISYGYYPIIFNGSFPFIRGFGVKNKQIYSFKYFYQQSYPGNTSDLTTLPIATQKAFECAIKPDNNETSYKLCLDTKVVPELGGIDGIEKRAAEIMETIGFEN